MNLTIYGPPRSKKNSQTPVRLGKKCPVCKQGTGRPLILPSPQWKAWIKGCRIEIDGKPFFRCPVINKPVNCCAIFYMDTKRSVDAVNMYEGLADLLEHYAIIENDKWIVSWDGSRIDYDKGNPRVEVALEEV